MAVFSVLVLLILLFAADRVGCLIAENDMESQFTASGFPVRPAVTIEGFPFLTQLLGQDFKQVDISASNVPAGPVTVNSVKATLTGMHISRYSTSATARVDHVSATAFISFGALADAGRLGGAGVTLTPAGPDTFTVKVSLGGLLTASGQARVEQTGPQTISIKVVTNGSAAAELLSAFGPFSFNLPKGVPASLRITHLTLNSQGLTVDAAATNAAFSK